ncbi:MAG: transglycosylase domain-containing protein [Pseudomonadota bacterium]
MTARARWLVWPLRTISVLLLLVVVLCFGAYAWGARLIPDDIPASSYCTPDAIRDQYLAVEANGATGIRKLNPVTFWIDFFMSTRQFPEPPPPEEILLYRATRAVQFKHSRARTQGEHHLASIALAVKIGRQWTRDEAVNTILAESWFSGGRSRKDVIGIEAAAEFYFGVPLAELQPQESLVLIALLKSPSWYDPFCNRERFGKRYAQTVEKLGKTGPEWSAAAALSRLRPIGCDRS